MQYSTSNPVIAELLVVIRLCDVEDLLTAPVLHENRHHLNSQNTYEDAWSIWRLAIDDQNPCITRRNEAVP